MTLRNRLIALAGLTALFFNSLFSVTKTWDGSSSSSWGTSANWTPSGVPGNGDDVIIPAGLSRYPVLSGGTTVASIVMNGGSLDMDNETLEVSGNFTLNAGVLDTDREDLRINGIFYINGGSIINSNTGNSEIRADEMILDFSGTLTLASDIRLRVDNSMTLTEGIIDNGTYVEFRNDATVSGASDTSYISGQVRKVGNDAFTFPIGGNGTYAPISISAPGNTGHHFTAQYIPAAYSDLSVNNTLDHVSLTEYWSLLRTNGSSNVNVTLSYQNPRSGEIDATSDLRVASYVSGDWVNVGASVSGNNASGTVATTTALNTFLRFTIGSSSALNPLPVKLLNFSAALQSETSVEIKWSTINESNSDFFEVERSLDGKKWQVIGIQQAAGASDGMLNYAMLDVNHAKGIQYYRLKQIDLDGRFEYSEMISVVLGQKPAQVVLFPNPASNIIYVSIDHVSVADLECSIIDASGRMLMKTADLSSGIDISALTGGVYTLRILADGVLTYKTFTKQ